MYDSRVPDGPNRRADNRLRLQLYLNEYVKDREYRALATDISELPGTNELIWAAAEPRFDAVGADFHVSGLRFRGMARKHQRLLRDYVRERRLRIARLLRIPRYA